MKTTRSLIFSHDIDKELSVLNELREYMIEFYKPISYEKLANEIYAKSDKLDKAIAAGRQLDNSLIKEYGSEGSTKCHFRIDQYLKYFDYEAIKNL